MAREILEPIWEKSDHEGHKEADASIEFISKEEYVLSVTNGIYGGSIKLTRKDLIDIRAAIDVELRESVT